MPSRLIENTRKNQFKMKSVNKIKEKKRKIMKKPKLKGKKEKVLVVAQEIKFARLLSGNDKKTRDKVLKSFKKWLLSCFERGHEFKEDDFIRVWKGLFYAVWMSDKPLVQEELCETIAGILDLFPPEQVRYALLMSKAGFKVLATEWYGIDHHRMDKFLMLIRRYLRGSLRCVARCKWKPDVCKLFAESLAGSDGILALKTPLYARNAGSMLLHVVDCYLEEISKVSEGQIPEASVVELLRPICEYMVRGPSLVLCVACRRVLTQLLRQSDQGLEYREKTMAWQHMGCPRGGPDALELASDDEEDNMTNGHHGEDDDEEEIDESEKPLDPRAGRVDVVLHPVPVPASGLAEVLKGLLASASSMAYKRTKICLQRFEQLAKDEYPLRVEDPRDEAEPRPRARPSQAATQLRALEKKLVAASDELALRGLSRKHRKRLLAKSRAGLSIVDDVPQANITSTNGAWAVEATEPKAEHANKQTDSTSNKENVHKDKKSKKRKLLETQTDKNNKKLTKKDKNNKNELNKVKQKMKVKDAGNKEQTNKIVNNTPQTQDKHKKESEIKTIKNLQIQPVKLISEKHKTQENRIKIVSPKTDKTKKFLNGKVEKRQQERVQLSKTFETPKKVKFVLKNNSMQGTVDYYKSVRQSPSIPFDSSRKPTKTNLKVSTPSPINPFFKKKLRLK